MTRAELDRAVIDELFEQVAFERARVADLQSDIATYRAILSEALQAHHVLGNKHEGLKVRYFRLLDERRQSRPTPRRAA